MAGRRRIRLVPNDAVECFEVRSVLYFDRDGNAMIDVDASDESGNHDIPVHEILGVLVYSALILAWDGLREQEDD